MEPRIESLSQKYLVGIRTAMSFSNNKTKELWQSFMPKRKDIKNVIGTELYSVEVYPPLFFEKFDSTVEFEKWAAVEVSNLDSIYDDMESIEIPNGLYAVFIHKGPASEGRKTYNHIFTTWLPNSEYVLDDRPHFAVMGEKYKHEDANSEEEIWIPINPKMN